MRRPNLPAPDGKTVLLAQGSVDTVQMPRQCRRAGTVRPRTKMLLN